MSTQTTDPTGLTIAEAQRLVRRRDLSPVELVEAYAARIRRLDPRLNAFVTVTEERAVAALMLQPLAGYDPRDVASIEAEIEGSAREMRRWRGSRCGGG